jgi:hypothetical protein
MNVSDISNSLIVFINLCKIKNMIHLSSLELNEFSSIFIKIVFIQTDNNDSDLFTKNSTRIPMRES